jgi:hypothetical protein
MSGSCPRSFYFLGLLFLASLSSHPSSSSVTERKVARGVATRSSSVFPLSARWQETLTALGAQGGRAPQEAEGAVSYLDRVEVTRFGRLNTKNISLDNSGPLNTCCLLFLEQANSLHLVEKGMMSLTLHPHHLRCVIKWL